MSFVNFFHSIFVQPYDTNQDKRIIEITIVVYNLIQRFEMRYNLIFTWIESEKKINDIKRYRDI